MTTEMMNAVKVLALSVQQEMGEAFVKAVCGEGSNTRKIGSSEILLDALAGDPRLNAAWDDTIKEAGGVLILTRFLDVITLDKIKAIYRRMPTDKDVPLAMVIVRENNESDFKMSCPVCGQKLWVRDSDAGKRGRCPNCKKAFTLPDQVTHLRAQLALPDAVPVLRVVGGETSSSLAALEKLLPQLEDGLIEQSAGLDEDVLKQSTIRVQINPDEM